MFYWVIMFHCPLTHNDNKQINFILLIIDLEENLNDFSSKTHLRRSLETRNKKGEFLQ